jgi:hypothetical protein
MPNEWRRLNDSLVEIVQDNTGLAHLSRWVLVELWQDVFAKRNPAYPPKQIKVSISQAIALLNADLINPHHNLEQHLIPYCT